MKTNTSWGAAAALGTAVALGVSSTAFAQFVNVTEGMLLDPPIQDWLHMSRTYNQHHYSPLTQITPDNVHGLRLAWARGLPALGSRVQSTPIVSNGVMYLVGPGDVIMAVNASTGDQIWERVPEYEADRARSKSIGIYEDMIYWPTFDGFIRALNAETGETVWEAPMVGRTGNRNSAGGVLVADGMVLMNGSCQALTVDTADTTGRKGCYIVAVDAMTGEEVWKTYTVPADGEPLADSWPAAVTEERRNASPWGLPGSYDPDLGLTYWGTADPKPYPQMSRYATEIGLADGQARGCKAPCDAYSNSTLALNITDGEIMWYFQGLPGDSWDMDHNQDRLIITSMFNPDPNHIKWINPDARTGVERKFVLYNSEGGGQFAVDAATGAFLWGRPYPYDLPNINHFVDNVRTGQTIINFDIVMKKDGDQVYQCFHNTRNWQPMSYSPRTNSQYIYFLDRCLDMNADSSDAARGYTLRSGAIRRGVDPSEFGTLERIDMVTGERHVLWHSDARYGGPILPTASGLLFMGTGAKVGNTGGDGVLRAFNDETGAVLWEQDLGDRIWQGTISYQSGGKQYVMTYGEAGNTFTVFAFSLP